MWSLRPAFLFGSPLEHFNQRGFIAPIILLATLTGGHSCGMACSGSWVLLYLPILFWAVVVVVVGDLS